MEITTCDCGVELFEKDIVDSIIDIKVGDNVKILRCPKCFKLIKSNY